MSSERDVAVPALDVRVCTPPTGALRFEVYVTPADAPEECLVVRGYGSAPEVATLRAIRCDALGLASDGSWRDGSRVAEAVVTVEGTVPWLPGGAVRVDLRIGIVTPEETRLVRVDRTIEASAASDSGCYARAASP